MRVTSQTLSFSSVDLTSATGIEYVPYVVRSGVSMAANLRTALQNVKMLFDREQTVRVLIASECLLVPTQEFNENKKDKLLLHAFPHLRGFTACYNVLPELNAVAVFAVNKDLNTVLTDHFAKVTYITLTSPVWRQMYQRNFTGQRRKLYAYFHEDKMEVAAFRQNRFCFCNSYSISNVKDVVYYLLFAWKTLALDVNGDELHIAGIVNDRDMLDAELHRYLSNVYFVNPIAEFNRAPITKINNIPFDLVTLFIHNR